jgi:type II secretory pathway predicted ATPase ExeA
MLAAYFGFKGEPFEDASGSAFVAGNLHLRGIAAQLLAGIGERKGLMVVIGEPASGRKLLLRHVAGELRGRYRSVAIDCSPGANFEEILARCCTELGVPDRGGRERQQRARALVGHLISQMADGRTTVLLVDEAQHLDDEALRNLFLLAQLGERRTVQIVLAARGEIESRFAVPDLGAALRGAALRCQLPALRAEDFQVYVETELQRVGAPEADLFDRESIERVASLLHERPELVDRLCTQALVITRLEGQRTVTADAVEQAARAVMVVPPQRPRPTLAEKKPAARITTPAPGPSMPQPRSVLMTPAEPATVAASGPVVRVAPDLGPGRAARRQIATSAPEPALALALPEPTSTRPRGRFAVAALASTAFIVLGGGAWTLKDQIARTGLIPLVHAAIDTRSSQDALTRIAPAAGSSSSPEEPGASSRGREAAAPAEPIALAALDRTDQAALQPVAIAASPRAAEPTAEQKRETSIATLEPRPADEAAAGGATRSASPAASSADQQFMARGNALLASGDFAGARLFFERAAAGGNPRAVTALGKTYDPVFFAEAGFPAARGDAERAADWYRKAAEAGDAEAAARLRRLQGRR